MNEQQDDLKIYSEEVRDVLSHPPKSIFIWGNTILFAFFIILIAFTWVIKYPEFVPAPILVTSENPPEKLEARTNSKIEKILIENNTIVKKDEILMVLESSANYQDVLKLKTLVDSLDTSQMSSFPLAQSSKLKLGELQGEFNTFAKALQDQRLFSQLQPYAPEDLAANQSISEYKSRVSILKQQMQLENAKFALSKKNYERSQSLFAQGVISKMEVESEKIQFLQAEQNLKNIQISLSQLNEGISNLQKTKSGASINTQKDTTNYSSQTLQLLEQLRKSLKQWEQTYLVRSSTNGVVSFQQFWGENQFVKVGDALVSILPTNKERVVGRMFIPSTNSGKVIPGLKVLIKLDNYQYQEYGMVEGKVQNVSLSPDKDGNYYVDVLLTNGLKTSYNKELPFDKELKGNAEIVTQDLRLIERFFYQMRKLLGYQS